MKFLIYLLSSLLLGLTVLTDQPPTAFQKQLYGDPALISRSDIGSYSSPVMEETSGETGNTLETVLLDLTGSTTLLDRTLEEPGDLNLSYDLRVREGKGKLVSIDSQNHVTVLREGSGAGSLSLHLPEGQVRIKAVGLDCSLSLSLQMS